MIKNTINTLLASSTGLGVINAFVQFANQYFTALSCAVLIFSLFFKISRFFYLKQYRKKNNLFYPIYIKMGKMRIKKQARKA